MAWLAFQLGLSHSVPAGNCGLYHPGTQVIIAGIARVGRLAMCAYAARSGRFVAPKHGAPGEEQYWLCERFGPFAVCVIGLSELHLSLAADGVGDQPGRRAGLYS